jgi:eukaryotic-like serine/threonine-protein kinase
MTGPRTLAGRYRLERPLAFGGASEVWIATDVVLDRRVAVKMLRPEHASDPQIVERFRREAIAAAQLNHPNIVSLFDTVNEDGLEAVVLELVPGRTLRQMLDDEGRLSVNETVHIGVALADALDAAHRAGLVHRDVKPANVLITPARRVMLTDFGIATAVSKTSDVTLENVMQGTAKYLSPEQVLGVPTDGRSDLFSLGVVLYECLTGRVPYEGDSDASVALARLQHVAKPPRALRPGVPKPLDELIRSCLTRSPDGRPASGAVVRDSLMRLEGTLVDDGRLVIDRDPTPSGMSSPLPKSSAQTAAGTRRAPIKQRPGRWTVAFGLVLLLGLGAGVAGAILVDRSIEVTHSVRTDSDGPVPISTTTIVSVPDTSAVPSTTAIQYPRGIVGTQEFDPPPGDGTENPDELSALTDGDLTTDWFTLCYDENTLAPKKGVGIVFRLTEPANDRLLSIVSATTDWDASVYVASAKPDSLKGWGTPVAVGRAIPAGRADFPLRGDGSFVLLWISRLGSSTGCRRPYQVRIADAQITPA